MAQIKNFDKLEEMTIFGFILALILFLSSVHAETFGLLLSGGRDLNSNHYNYYDSMKKMHQALRSRGVKRDHIMALYADGGDSRYETRKRLFYSWGLSFNAPTSFGDDDVRDIWHSANRVNISRSFKTLAGKMKPGDHLVFFITDHGSKKKTSYCGMVTTIALTT